MIPVSTHDLIRLRDPMALAVDGSIPVWVEPELRRTPWVVVRRGHVRDGMIPVGVRGKTRAERFGAWLAVSEIAERLSPEDLTGFPYVKQRDGVPALAALARVAPLLAHLGWGPGGSVGFELATGVAKTTASSDLDLILRQDRRLEPQAARALRDTLVAAAAPARIDVLLETPHGGVSLGDLAAAPAHVLLRTPDGARLVSRRFA